MSPAQYFIWSARNKLWWRANRAGYTDTLEQAGQYFEEEASKIMFNGLPGGNVAISCKLAHDQLEDCTPEFVEAKLSIWRTL